MPEHIKARRPHVDRDFFQRKPAPAQLHGVREIPCGGNSAVLLDKHFFWEMLIESVGCHCRFSLFCVMTDHAPPPRLLGADAVRDLLTPRRRNNNSFVAGDAAFAITGDGASAIAVAPQTIHGRYSARKFWRSGELFKPSPGSRLRTEQCVKPILYCLDVVENCERLFRRTRTATTVPGSTWCASLAIDPI